MFPATLSGGNGSVHSGGVCAIRVTAVSRMSMLDKNVGASTLRLGFISDLSAQPGCGLLDFTLSPKPRAPARVSAKGNGRKKWFLFLTSRACQTASLTFLQCYVSSALTPFFSINCSLYRGPTRGESNCSPSAASFGGR